MSKGRDIRDAERAARRARRLAERAEERAKRKERQAERATERAEKLAERVKRRPKRERDLENSIEDLVDEVTAKAEEWIDEQTKKLFEDDSDPDVKRAEGKAQRARREAQRAREEAEEAEIEADAMFGYSDESAYGESYDDVDFEDYGDYGDEYDARTSRREAKAAKRARRKARKKARRERRRSAWGWMGGGDWQEDLYGMGMSGSRRPWRWHRRTGHLYRDRDRKRILGVCAGIADHFGRSTWEIRLYAILGLVFLPSLTVPAYFITYFVMDEKPYYRRVTDRFDAAHNQRKRRRRRAGHDAAFEDHLEDNEAAEPQMREPELNNMQALKVAKDKFNDIEHRLRQMETHVTSSRFELQRELKKISGEDA